MPPRAVRDGSSSFYANNPSNPLFADLFFQSRLRWPGLCRNQAMIVVTFLMEGVYRSERPPMVSTFDNQRLALHDAIFVHFQAFEFHLPGLRVLCRHEIERVASDMPLLTFVGCLNGYREWIVLNRWWFSSFLYQRIRSEMPDAVGEDERAFRPLALLRQYSLLLDVAATLFIAFDDINQARVQNSD
ncbi:hypothetical protein FSPOR_8735 [Fusarium sporotrichioides]|uniref:Uncharacterized protein n=1 Tax=Fusarium sporotrichioides TaxID=5514 RepID=A0A395RT72_FUSSP|nr:hypothetical protein FSPOR_8735 [Fusarium sporotrichioides]